MKLHEENKASFGVINVLPHKVTVPKYLSIARIIFLTAKQADYFQPTDIAFLTNYFSQTINSHTSDHEMPAYTSTEKHWFHTPGNCSNLERLKGINSCIYDEIVTMTSQETN